MTIDNRKLSREALADIRIKAVLQVENGKIPEEVIDTLGLHRSVFVNIVVASTYAI